MSEMPGAAIGQASKTALRSAFAEKLKTLSQDEVEAQSKAATQHLQVSEVYQKAQTISVFMSMPKGELQTSDIVKHALQAGKRVYIPYIRRKPPTMHMLHLRDLDDFHTLQPDKWGIPSLDKSTIEGRANCLGYRGLEMQGIVNEESSGLDLVLMPSVAFDEDRNRLGHGKGYYDRFLTRYLENRKSDGTPYQRPYLLGLALREQILSGPDRLPTESWDHRVDAVLTADGLY